MILLWYNVCTNPYIRLDHVKLMLNGCFFICKMEVLYGQPKKETERLSTCNFLGGRNRIIFILLFFICSFVTRNIFYFTVRKWCRFFRTKEGFCHSNCGYVAMEMQKACACSPLWRRCVSCEELGALFCWQGHSCYGSGYRELQPAHIVYFLPLVDSILLDAI